MYFAEHQNQAMINDADQLAMIQARVAKKDPAAINNLYNLGACGLQNNMKRAVELFTEAAELGSIDALYKLGLAYYHGMGVEKDEAKAAEFYKRAAMQGCVESRHKLGYIEGQKGNYDRAVRHWMISAKNGP